MRRETIPMVDIADMTMSSMREKQSEACENRLLCYPGVSLFDTDADESLAEQWLQMAFPEPDMDGTVPGLFELRKRVKLRMPLELKFISSAEAYLLEMLLEQDGVLLLEEWDDIAAVEALVKRMWCTVRCDRDEWYLVLPQVLQMPVSKVLEQKRTAQIRQKLNHFDTTVYSILYLSGFVLADEATSLLLSDVMHRDDEIARTVATRYVESTFEYDVDQQGRVLLLHPGLHSAAGLIVNRHAQGFPATGMLNEASVPGIAGIFPQEVPCIERLCGALIGALRPEYDPMEAVQDLHMLIKQNVDFDDVKRVMGSMLAVLPTTDMKESLKSLWLNAPRWTALETPVVN